MTNLPLIVMYHYVWPDGQPIPGGIRPLLASEFRRQLDWLEEHFRIVSPDLFLEELAAKKFAGRPPCLLTFDDGTRDHAEVVTPILAQRRLGGVFFVLTWPIELNRMPLTHAVHWLLGQDEAHLWNTFEQAAAEHLGSADALGNAADARRVYHYETPLRARIKYAANMALPSDVARRVVDRCIAQSGTTSADLARLWFAQPEQLVQMQAAGMTIGVHGCSHRSLQVLGADGITSEIEHCSDYLTALLGGRPRWFACPFGGSGAAPNALAAMNRAMDRYAIVAAVTTEKTLVPISCDPKRLPRLDAIDLPPRKLQPGFIESR